jgi:hypothetical protein
LKPARYDITVYQRATFRRRFTLPFDCTGHTIEAQIWSNRRVTKIVQFDVEWVNQEEGIFELVADFTQTSTTVKNGKWDLMVVYPNQDRNYWVEGDVIVDPGYTEPVNA